MEKQFIERVQIKGLWGRVDLDWHLNPDVNILLGENGTGKSTVLKLMAACLIEDFSGFRKIEFEEVELRGSNAFVRRLQSLHEFSDGFHHPSLSAGLINSDYINTFEYAIPEKNGHPDHASNLDHELDLATRRYLAYQAKQSNKVFSQKMNFEEAFKGKKYLIETLNRLFRPTGKTVDENESELEFLIDGRAKIKREDLSSGEKQLLIILLTTLCQESKPSVLLLDEPEISLHLHWQYEFIEIIRNLNPNCQLILATHSPSVFNDGWRDKVFWMENLTKKMPQPA